MVRAVHEFQNMEHGLLKVKVHCMKFAQQPGCHKVWHRGTAGARHNIFCEAQNGKHEQQKRHFFTAGETSASFWVTDVYLHSKGLSLWGI